MQYYKGDQAQPVKWGVSECECFPMTARVLLSSFTFAVDLTGLHRGEFLQMFASRIKSTRCQTHFFKKFRSYETLEDGQVAIQFADGTETKCDILIGADGVRSTVRQAMYTKFEQRALAQGQSAEESKKFRFYIPPKWSGELLYRCLVTKEDLQKTHPDHISLKTQLYVSDVLRLDLNTFLISVPSVYRQK